MTDTIIFIGNITSPSILLNELQRTIVIVQVHRQNTWWEYSSVEAAQAILSANGFQLYMYLERQNTRAPWSLWPRKVSDATSLSESTLPKAVQELKKKGYLTPGKIEWDGKLYETNFFHFWERPERCHIDYGDTAA